MLREMYVASAELKFVGEPGETGQLQGYGSVFNVLDSYGDMIAPGAFDVTLAEQKSSGRIMPMFGEHSFAFMGGDPYPIGYWTKVEPDAKGLRVEGKFVGLGHPDVARAHELAKAGLLKGLSIAFKAKESVKGTKVGEPKRLLKSLELFSIDLVGDPANPLATVDNIKAMLNMPNHQAAAQALQDAHQMCTESMGGGDAPTSDERNQITGKIKEAYRHVTGQDMPVSAKAIAFDQLRELKKWLHLPVEQNGRGFSAKQADEIAELVFKSTSLGESGDHAAATAARKEAVANIRAALSGFSLKPGE